MSKQQDAVDPPPAVAPRTPQQQHLLQCCAEWRLARAEVEKACAETELDYLDGMKRANSHDHMPAFERMKVCEDELCIAEPDTARAAAALLGVANVMLSTKEADPDRMLAGGPALPILRNVLRALRDTPEDTPLATDVV